MKVTKHFKQLPLSRDLLVCMVTSSYHIYNKIDYFPNFTPILCKNILHSDQILSQKCVEKSQRTLFKIKIIDHP